MTYAAHRTPDHSVDREKDAGATLLHSQFDADTAAKLVAMGIVASFEPGQLIFQENDESGQFYFVIAGSIALEQSMQGRVVRIQTLHETDFLGWSAVLGSGTRHFQARALTRVRALTFDGAFLRRKCEDDPRLGYALMKRLFMIVTERLDATRARDWAAASAASESSAY